MPTAAAHSLATTLQRARSALEMPTLYWLRFGGHHARGAVPPQPGTPIDVDVELEALRRSDKEKARAYQEGLDALGLMTAQLPPLACDCSGFVLWAMGLPRDCAELGGLSTTVIHRDAMRGQRIFEKLDRPIAGALLVHPRQERDGHGHVGIVAEVDPATGLACEVIHCAPENFSLDPPPGLPRNAIACTGPERFLAVADTICVQARRRLGD